MEKRQKSQGHGKESFYTSVHTQTDEQTDEQRHVIYKGKDTQNGGQTDIQTGRQSHTITSHSTICKHDSRPKTIRSHG